MNLRNYIFGGVLAYTIGCASPVDKTFLGYEMKDTGIAVPKLGKVLVETHRSNDLTHHLIRKYDTNSDNVPDMIEIVTDDLSGVKPTQRNLIVDTNKDGIADAMYSDIARKEYAAGKHSEKVLAAFTPGADGKFDIAADASLIAAMILGKDHMRNELTLDKLADHLMGDLEK